METANIEGAGAGALQGLSPFRWTTIFIVVISIRITVVGGGPWVKQADSIHLDHSLPIALEDRDAVEAGPVVAGAPSSLCSVPPSLRSTEDALE